MYLLFLSQLFKVYEGTSGNTASFTSSWKMHVIKNDSCISKNFAPQQSSFILIFYKYFKHPHMPCVTHQIQFFLPCQYYGKGGIKSRNISESPSLLKFHQVDFGLWTSLSLEINSDFLQNIEDSESQRLGFCSRLTQKLCLVSPSCFSHTLNGHAQLAGM